MEQREKNILKAYIKYDSNEISTEMLLSFCTDYSGCDEVYVIDTLYKYHNLIDRYYRMLRFKKRLAREK